MILLLGFSWCWCPEPRLCLSVSPCVFCWSCPTLDSHLQTPGKTQRSSEERRVVVMLPPGSPFCSIRILQCHRRLWGSLLSGAAARDNLRRRQHQLEHRERGLRKNHRWAHCGHHAAEVKHPRRRPKHAGNICAQWTTTVKTVGADGSEVSAGGSTTIRMQQPSSLGSKGGKAHARLPGYPQSSSIPCDSPAHTTLICAVRPTVPAQS